MGLVVILITGMGFALATAPAAAQSSSNWWNGDDDDDDDDDDRDGRSSDRGSAGWWGGDDDDDDDDDGPPEDPTVESASAEITGTSSWSDRVSEVTFTVTATEGENLRLEAGRTTKVVRATGSEQEISVQTGYFWGISPPVDVSASVRDTTCSGSLAAGSGVTQLCESTPDPEPEPEPNFGVDVASTNSPVSEGETLTIDATAENTGDAAGTQDVTVSALGQSTTESVSLGPGESQTVSLSVETSAGDAGTYTASVSTDGDSASVDVTVESVPTEGTVEGIVADADSGQGIGGATVSAGDAETTTADDGSYSLTLAEGDYTVSANADGYESASQDVTVTAGETTTADLGLTATPEPDPATFQLSNPSVNAPTAGQAITVDATVENTGGQDGTQTVSLSVGDLGSDSQDVTLGAGESTSVSLSVATSEGDAGTYSAELSTADDSVSTEVTVSEAATEGTVEGTVTDSESGQAIAGATVSAGGAETTTASDGSYSLTLSEGSYTLQVSADGYESASQDVSVTAGETATADVGLTATPDPATFELSNPSANAPTEGQAITVDATVENTGGQEGTQTVSLSVGSLGTDSQELTLGAGESTSVSLSVATSEGDAGTHSAELSTADDSVSTDVTVSEAVTDGTVEGTVTDSESGNPIAGATVSSGGAQTTTASDGSYSLTLAEGDYTVSANAESYQSASQDVTVTAGETTTADVALDPVVTEGTVEGTVTDADSGQGVGGATVSAGDAETTTADDGSYSLTLTEGDYTVSANADGYESASQSVTVTAGETSSVDLDLAPEAAGPQEFTAYVRGTDAYLHTNVTSGSTNPIEFTECRDYEPTQDAINNTPDNLPAPSCTTINGTYYPSNNTWTGDVDFPAVVQQRTHDLLGEILVEASITTDGATGTMNRETGEITMDASVDIGIQIYAPENGHDHEWSNRPDPITDSTCRVPSLGIELSTEKSYESQSSFTGGGTVSGQRMGADGVSYLVTNDFPVDGATGCGNFGGLVPLNGSINDVLGIPTDAGQNEVAFDVETDFEE